MVSLEEDTEGRIQGETHNGKDWFTNGNEHADTHKEMNKEQANTDGDENAQTRENDE